jgi:methylenetetrahydrofolate reductase (NADPH)
LKTFSNAIRTQEFAISAELSLTPDASAETIAIQAELLKPHVDGVLLTDNQYGQVHMSTLAAASLFLQNGVDPILQLSCRNRNRIALLSDILGARALGISSLLLVRGNKIPEGYKPRPKSMMDIDAQELIATARMVKDDDNYKGTTDFYIGTSATAHEPQQNWQPKQLLGKLDAGAQFIQTQTCLDASLIKRYMTQLVAAKIVRRANMIIGVATLPSAQTAQWLRDNRRKILIPDSVIERLDKAPDPVEEGIRICAETIRQLAKIPGVAGVSILPMGDLTAIPAAIEMSGIKTAQQNG